MPDPAYKYGYPGPPFNFLGHMSMSQFQAFQAYVNAKSGDFPAIQQHHQIRAAVLRRTAGVLERYYQTLNDEKLAPTFLKETWKPAPEGWFGYQTRSDQLPMAAMARVKATMTPRLERQDEGVFQMNHVRNVIEKTEDKAQRASEAKASVIGLLRQIAGYFNQPEYQSVLVKDTTDVYPAGSGQPRFRVNPLDFPTQWEREQAAHQLTQGGPTSTKDVGQ